MLIYLDHALTDLKTRRESEGAPLTHEDLREAIMFGAVERVRPKMMTVVAIMAGLLPIDALLHLTNIGTLLAFVIVCAAVLIMRKKYPDAERPFRCPWVPVVPILGILSCLMLMFSLPTENWWRLIVWLGLGFLIYFLYGRTHSVMYKAGQ
jgi:amino acid transporter